MSFEFIWLFVNNLARRVVEFTDRRLGHFTYNEGLHMLEKRKFKVGDRVVYEVLPLRKNQVSFIRHGVVVDISSYRLVNLGYVTEHYTVRWDDGKVEPGYVMGGGLQPEPIPIPTVQ